MTDKLQQGKFDSFTIISNGLIETDLLTEHEKIVYIVIRKHLNQESQVAFPGMTTISREARISKSQVLRAIKGLEEKRLLIVKRQTTKYNEKKTNIYRFNDFAELWKAKTINELKKIATETPIPLTDDEIINKALQIDKRKRQKLYTQLAKEFEKEKEPETLQADQSNNISSTQLNNIDINKDNTNKTKSQELERYTIDQIHQLFDYDIMLQDNPYQQNDIDSVMDILYTTMNTTKAIIRIAGEDKPSMVVIGKLMKLHNESIMYAIEKYKEQTERIKNPTAYMLTILYNAPEQFNLDIKNQVSHDMAHWNTKE
ncbi:MAG: hypothetical protein HDT28_07640 [Clostridiales bacterium]|nr:hypothetical protein [Clostridiales bacterium]